MAFLAPLFFIALATFAIPIVIHLTQRERKQIIEFPSLMFLQRIPYQSVRRRRIRDWPLLVTDSTEWRTTQVGIAVFRSSEIAVYNLQMAATLIVLLPTLLLLILGQRQLVRGLTEGALKG